MRWSLSRRRELWERFPQAMEAALERHDQILRAAVAASNGQVVKTTGDGRSSDYFGPVVNRAARIMAAGHGGQVLLSAAAAELVADRLAAGASLRDLGLHRRWCSTTSSR